MLALSIIRVEPLNMFQASRCRNFFVASKADTGDLQKCPWFGGEVSQHQFLKGSK